MPRCTFSNFNHGDHSGILLKLGPLVAFAPSIRRFIVAAAVLFCLELGGDGFPGRVGEGTPGILLRGGETGRGICGASGGFPEGKSPSPRLPEIIIISPIQRNFGENFLIKNLLLNFYHPSVRPSVAKIDSDLDLTIT